MSQLIMRHLTKGRKFHRKTGQRTALMKGLANNLIMAERITTTEAKAKELKPEVEKLVTLAKKQDTASLRLLIARIPKQAAEKMFYEVAPKYKGRRGGYLRIVKGMEARMRDGSQMATIEFVQ